MKKKISIWSSHREYQKEKRKIHQAIERVFNSGQFILGKQVRLFEEEFANFCQSKYAVGVGNGTDAIFIALKTLGIGNRDEVITVPNTAIPTVSAIVAAGARPVFVDILSDTYLIDPDKIEERITKKTKVILPVHLYGQCCEMDKINKIAKKHKLFVLEDCAQATGASFSGRIAGSMSDIAAFSFYPTKVIGAYGDGGMIVTKKKSLAERARMMRMYGTKGEYYSYFLGYNSRLDELHASMLRYKLRRIASYIKKRKAIVARYETGLHDTPLQLPVTHKDADHVWYLYVVRHQKREAIINFLKKHNIIVNISYQYPLHLMKAFRFLGYKKVDFPIAEKVANEIFSIPIYPELTFTDQHQVIATLRKFFRLPP